MGEDEDDESAGKESSKSNNPRGRPHPKPKSHHNMPSHQGVPSGPSRPQRQRRRNGPETSTATIGPSNLNPSATEFVPQQAAAQSIANENTGPSTNAPPTRSRRDGRRGNNHKHTSAKEKDTASGETSSQSRRAGPPRRSRKPENNSGRVQPKIIKESEDLMLRMTEALAKGEYDCSICTDSVFPYAHIYLLGRFSAINQSGRVKLVGQSFTSRVSRNGLVIHLEKALNGGVPAVRPLAIPFPMRIDVGVKK